MRMVLAVMLMTAGGAAVSVPSTTFATHSEIADVTDRQSQTIPLPAAKTLSIEITVGNVRIDAWDRPDVEIIVERKAPASAQLTRVPLSIQDAPESVTVRAIQIDNGTSPELRTDVSVKVPRGALIERVKVMEGRIVIEGLRGRIAAEILRGPIDGKDLSGTVRLETEIGSVTVTGARLTPNGLLRMRTFNGDVRLTLAERPVDARILALALNGQIRSSIPLTMKDTWGPRWGETTIGKGEPLISLDVVTGAIEIKGPSN